MAYDVSFLNVAAIFNYPEGALVIGYFYLFNLFFFFFFFCNLRSFLFLTHKLIRSVLVKRHGLKVEYQWNF